MYSGNSIFTVQSRRAVEVLINDGEYQPDFRMSPFKDEVEGLHLLYASLLRSFNVFNATNLPGLIFGFGRQAGLRFRGFRDFRDFYGSIIASHPSIMSLWAKFLENDSLILEVRIPETIRNLMLIDMNDFQALMPPVMEIGAYDRSTLERISERYFAGEWGESPFPSYLIQANIGNIRASEVLGVYEMFDPAVLHASDENIISMLRN